MREISPEELFNQLRETIAILAAPARQQRDFLSEGVPAPVDDLFVQLDIVVPAWFNRLEHHGLIDQTAEMAIMSLYDHLDRMSRSGDLSLWTGDDALFTKQEWEEVREHARNVLDIIGPSKVTNLVTPGAIRSREWPILTARTVRMGHSRGLKTGQSPRKRPGGG